MDDSLQAIAKRKQIQQLTIRKRSFLEKLVADFGGEVIHTEPPIKPMPSQSFKIASGTLVSIKPADDTNQPWKSYTTRKEAIGERVAGSSGAIVIQVGAWLILTRKSKAIQIRS